MASPEGSCLTCVTDEVQGKLMVAHMIAGAVRDTATATLTETDMVVVRSLLAEQMSAIERAAATLDKATSELPHPKEEHTKPKNPSYIG